jgi:recombination protein RecA
MSNEDNELTGSVEQETEEIKPKKRVAKPKAPSKEADKSNMSRGNLDSTLKNLSKAYKLSPDSFRVYDGQDIADVEVIPTGIAEINALLGVGGIPRACFVELFGLESSGKTWVGYNIAAEAQKMGERVLWLDVEGGFNAKRATDAGVNVSSGTFVEYHDFDSGEQVLELIGGAAESGEFGLVILDSVAALAPKQDLETDFVSKTGGMGTVARMISRLMPKVRQKIAKGNKCSVIFINQIRMGEIGSYMGAQEISPGGKTLKFLASLRIKLRRKGGNGGKIFSPEGDIVGGYTVAKLIKSRYGNQDEECIFPIYFKPFNRNLFYEILMKAKEANIMRPYGKKAIKYYYPYDGSELKCDTLEELYDYVIENDLLPSILAQLKLDTSEGYILSIMENAAELLADGHFEPITEAEVEQEELSDDDY